MPRRVVSMVTQTPTAYADATALVNATYPFMLRGGTAIQRNDIYELSVYGQATATSVLILVLAMDSTLAVGTNTMGAGQNDAPTDGSPGLIAANIALVGNTNATSAPQRSTTLKLHPLSMNAWGGIARIGQANADRPFMTVVGNVVNTGEMSVSAYTGGSGGPISATMTYESL